MSGLIIREITSIADSGDPLVYDTRHPYFRAYNKFGQWILKRTDRFRNELRLVAPEERIDFLSRRLRRNFEDTVDEGPRLLIQHTPDADIPAFDIAADIRAYHRSRVLALYEESDAPATAESILVLPDMSAEGLPHEGDVKYLLPLLCMVLRKISFAAGDEEQDHMMRAFFGATLVAKCR